MSDDTAKSEAQSRECKNSGAASCYLLPCPFCGFQPTQEPDGLVVCKKCLEKDIAIATPSHEEWNSRGPREFTREDLDKLFTAVERWIDDVTDDIEMSNFTWKDKVKVREKLTALSGKIRLWIGSR